MTEHPRSNLRDLIILVYGVFLGIIGNFLVEYVNMANPPSQGDLPSLVLFMLFMLGFYLLGAWYFLWRYG